MNTKTAVYEASYRDQLVDIWYRAVCRTHHFLTKEDIEFFDTPHA
ncbi:hypothetical protein [Brevibacillus sp. BC25]|nr:hypothetical protein [Brevibacillus sp. BC25]EJL27438.1 hypothetical protein PMI05_02773 [Brevibacillus sp. BC25]